MKYSKKEQMKELLNFKAVTVAFFISRLEESNKIDALYGDFIDTPSSVFISIGFSEKLVKEVRGAIYQEIHDYYAQNWLRLFFVYEIKNSGSIPKELGVVYAVEKETGHVKIGRTKHPKQRISALRTQSEIDIKRFFISDEVNKYGQLEIDLHKEFSSHRRAGEWFSVPFEAIVGAIGSKVKSGQYA